MPPTSALRTESSTPDSIDERIRQNTIRTIARTVANGPEAIETRLRELEREWDTKRVLEVFASSFTLTGLTLGLTVSRRWLALPGAVAAFLLQHALQGWCPPLPLIRAMGVRTAQEIDDERTALKAARGDFSLLANGSTSARMLLEAAAR